MLLLLPVFVVGAFVEGTAQLLAVLFGFFLAPGSALVPALTALTASEIAASTFVCMAASLAAFFFLVRQGSFFARPREVVPLYFVWRTALAWFFVSALQVVFGFALGFLSARLRVDPYGAPYMLSRLVWTIAVGALSGWLAAFLLASLPDHALRGVGVPADDRRERREIFFGCFLLFVAVMLLVAATPYAFGGAMTVTSMFRTNYISTAAAAFLAVLFVFFKHQRSSTGRNPRLESVFD